jgi:hypothetical protein
MGKLLAGAAKRKITIPEDIMKEMRELGAYTSFDGVYKDVYVRCLALSDGEKKFLIYSIESGSFPGQRIFREKLQNEFGVDPDAVMLGNTHNHQGVNASAEGESPPGMSLPTGRMGELNTWVLEYFHNQALDATREAIANFVPAKMGYESGESYINASRDWPTPLGGLQNSDYGGYSDRELPVMRVDSLDGKTIALVVNFGVHSNMLYICRFNGQFPYSCGDLGGEIMEFVENSYAGSAVCLWVEAAAGDQNPLMMGVDIGVKANPDGTYTRVQQDYSAKDTIIFMEHLAQVQGLEILKVSKKIKNMSDDFDLHYGHTTRTIPGKVNARTMFKLGFKGGDDYDRMEVMPDELEATPIEPSDPVEFKFHMAVLNGLAFCGVNTEPYSYLGRLVKDMLPYPKAMIFAIDSGHVGYIPDVRKAEYAGFGTLDNHAQSPWDTERAFYEGFRELAKKFEKE